MDESLGNTLRAAREAAGISVDDAVYLAKMPRAVVEALETDNFGFFSSPLYARSFLQQYGEYVGADVEPWINDLEPTTMIDGKAVESFIDISEPVAAAVVRANPKRGTGGGGAWAALWGILITAGTVWGGLKIYENFENKFLTQAQADILNPAQPAAGEAPKPSDRGGVEEVPIEPKMKENIAGVQPEPPRRAIIVREE